MNHTVYVQNGSIYNLYTGCIIERPAIVVSKEADTIHGYGNFEDVNAKFIRLANGYAKAGFQDDVDDLMLIELSEYHIDRELAGYVIRRATEFTATGFISSLCQKLTDGSDVISWLKSEMERIPIDLSESEWPQS